MARENERYTFKNLSVSVNRILIAIYKRFKDDLTRTFLYSFYMSTFNFQGYYMYM